MRLETAQEITASYGLQLEVRTEQHPVRTFTYLWLVKNGQEYEWTPISSLQSRDDAVIHRQIEQISTWKRFQESHA